VSDPLALAIAKLVPGVTVPTLRRPGVPPVTCTVSRTRLSAVTSSVVAVADPATRVSVPAATIR
jgi:hypothetical protein